MHKPILVADDSPEMLMVVSGLLERSGYTVTQASDGQEALRAVYERRPRLVVLDVEMPKIDGWQVLDRIRELSDIPVLMLTSEDAESAKVRGLRGGADDYVTKPFSRGELVARVEALLRRAGDEGPGEALDVTRVGEIEVDHRQQLATVAGQELSLTPLEFRLLAAFVRNPRQVLSGEQIIDLVWGEPYTSPEQVKLLVGRLRRKLAAMDPQPIETVRGFGYRFSIPAPE